jgi:hypothetical protein
MVITREYPKQKKLQNTHVTVNRAAIKTNISFRVIDDSISKCSSAWVKETQGPLTRSFEGKGKKKMNKHHKQGKI